MEQILFVNACVRTQSRTCDLAKHLLGKLTGAVTELNLDQEKISSLDRILLAQRNSALSTGDYGHPMLAYARQFAEADTIVIAAPYWDLAFPALLKTYLESVTVSGVTFRYNEHGIPVSLCRAKRLFYVTTAGGPIQWDFGFPYVEALARGFFGVGEVICFKAENLDIVGADVPAILSEAKKCIDRWSEGKK